MPVQKVPGKEPLDILVYKFTNRPIRWYMLLSTWNFILSALYPLHKISTFGYIVGASGSANTGKGGGGGAAASFQPPNAGGIITMGGEGGSGLVVIQYSA